MKFGGYMTVMIEDVSMECLVQKIASAQGKIAGDVVCGLALDQPPLRERLAKLALEIAALPKAVPNPLTDDAILGYDEQGIW